MVYALWTRQAVAELIGDRYGIQLAVRTMGRYLERLGFTPQEPMKKANERSPAAVKKLLDEAYPVIAACAKVEGAQIHWGDETGRCSEDVWTTSIWSCMRRPCCWSQSNCGGSGARIVTGIDSRLPGAASRSRSRPRLAIQRRQR